jgi:hypothetical protein
MAYQTTLTSGGIKNASTTILYGTVGGAVTSAPGKTAVSMPTSGQKNSNGVKASTKTGVYSNISYGNLSFYQDGKYIIAGYSSQLNGIAGSEAYLHRYYGSDKVRHNHMLNTVYSRKNLSWNLLTGQPTVSGIIDSFGRDDAISKSNGGEFVFIPAGKLPTPAGGNSKFYTYSAKTNG